MSKAIIWIVIIILIVLGGYFLWKQAATTPGGEEGGETGGGIQGGTFKIGGLLPLTGDGAAYGIPMQRAGLLAVEEINAAGGIDGKKIEMIWEDSKCDAVGGAAAAQKLVNVDKVKYIFGGACSSETLAASPITEEARVILLSPSATSPDVTKAGDFVFRTSPSDALAGRIAANYAYNTMKAKKAAVISETSDYPQGLRKVFTARFEELGGKIVADEQYDAGVTDFRTQVLKVKNSKPDVVYVVPQTPTPGILVLKQMKDQKVQIPVLTPEILIGRDVIAENKALVEGMIGIEQYFDETAPLQKKFIEDYRARFNEELAFPGYMANMYSQFFLLKQAIESVGDDTEKVRDYFYKVSDWEHALGSLTFDNNGDPLTSNSIKKVEGGVLKQIDVVKP